MQHGKGGARQRVDARVARIDTLHPRVTTIYSYFKWGGGEQTRTCSGSGAADAASSTSSWSDTWVVRTSWQNRVLWRVAGPPLFSGAAYQARKLRAVGCDTGQRGVGDGEARGEVKTRQRRAVAEKLLHAGVRHVRACDRPVQAGMIENRAAGAREKLAASKKPTDTIPDPPPRLLSSQSHTPTTKKKAHRPARPSSWSEARHGASAAKVGSSTRGTKFRHRAVKCGRRAPSRAKGSAVMLAQPVRSRRPSRGLAANCALTCPRKATKQQTRGRSMATVSHGHRLTTV